MIKVEQTEYEAFQKLLTPLWLKPERALWYAHEVSILSKILKSIGIPRYSVDIGCAEGFVSHILLNGSFKFEYDESREISIDEYTQRIDYDIPCQMQDIVEKKGDYIFDYGFSWRNSHLDKVKRLKIHKCLMCAPIHGPFGEISNVDMIFSPHLFWQDDIYLNGALCEYSNLLSEDGLIITIMPDKIQENYMYYHQLNEPPFDAIANLIDGGVYGNTTRQAKTYIQWKEYFASRHFTIEHHEMFLPSLVSKVYQIGFRPMFPVFKQMHDKLLGNDPSSLFELKKHWIDTAFHFMSPLCDTKWMKKSGIEFTWHAFVLRKQGGK